MTEQELAQNVPSNYLRIEPADTASKMTRHRLTPAYYSWAVSYLVADRSAVFAGHARDHIRDINEDLAMHLSLQNGESSAAPRKRSTSKRRRKKNSPCGRVRAVRQHAVRVVRAIDKRVPFAIVSARASRVKPSRHSHETMAYAVMSQVETDVTSVTWSCDGERGFLSYPAQAACTIGRSLATPQA